MQSTLRKGIGVALLAYKEAENLAFLLPQIKSNLEKTNEEYDILVVDTAEPLDDTASVCEQNGAKYINQEWPSFGGAFRTAIKYVDREKFLILDSDGSHDPNKISEINELFNIQKCDVVIGSRYAKGGITQDSKSSIVMSKILNTAFRICLGIQAKDISTDYRMYDTKQLKKVNLENKNYDVLQEVLLKMKLNNSKLKIGEVPITFTKRVFGESKRKLIPFIIDYIKSLFKLTSMRFPQMTNFILYGIFGVLGAVVEYIIFFFLTSTIWMAHPEVSNILGALGGFALTFSTNTFLNFKKKDKILFRLASYGGICLCGMFFSTTMLFLLKPYINIYVLKIILMVIVSCAQFIANKCVTYKS